MWRRLKGISGLGLTLALPGGIVLAGLVAFGVLAPVPMLIALGAMLILAVPLVVSLSALRLAIESLGPATPPRTEPAIVRWIDRFASPGTAAWPAVLRLNRAWREHAAEAEAKRAALEAVIEAVPDPLLLLDRQRRVVRANPACAAFIGAVTEPRDLAAALRNPALLTVADAVLRGDAVRSVEFSAALPVPRVLEARFAPIDGPSLDGAAAILTLHDVTALKRAEQMRADFIANAGHELKTPLATLIGFIETLLGPARDDAAARERFLGIMQEQSRRMARLVDDLLSLSRIELNEHVPPTGRVAIAPLIESLAAALELRAAERGMRFALSFPPELPDAIGDRDELAQVFQNLFDNAVKYGRPNTEITVTAEAAGLSLRVAVADCGDGISPEHLPRLTERFYRIDTARSRELGGTGLGLAIVKHIVNRHRGRLEIASTPGSGSTFEVVLRSAGL